MHVIERTDDFTLVGADARRGQADAVRRRGPARARRARARSCCACATSTPRSRPADRRSRRARGRRRRASRRPRACGSGSSTARRRSSTTSTTSCLRVPRPGGDAARGLAELGFERRRRRACASATGGCALEAAATPDGRAAAAQPHRAARRLRRRGRSARPSGAASRSPTSWTPRTRYAVFLWGPDRRQARVRRAQAELLPGLAVADLVVAGAGMAGLCAAAEARARGADVVVLEKGDRAGGSMLLSSGVIWRHRDFDALPRGVPRRRPSAPAARVRPARRRPRLARVARRAGRRSARPATRARRARASTPAG